MKLKDEKPLRAENLRLHNKNLVLSLLYSRRSAGISQSELVEKTGLKAPTIYRIFTSLIEENLIEPVETSFPVMDVTKRGRKPMNFCVRRDARYSIAVDFWSANLSIGVFNFWGERIHSSIQNLAHDTTADEIVFLISSVIKNTIAELHIASAAIIGVGVAAPGLVDLASEQIVYYPRIQGMRNYPIVEKLKNLLNLPVILHNNCSALALGEFRYGGFETQNSMFTFLFRTGVNGSFIDNGRIFINSKRQTLEIGHLPVCKNGPKCACGRKGCLQACISALCPDETVSFMFENVDPDSDSGRKILKAAAEYMAVVIRTIEKIFAPSSFLIVACNDRIAGMLSEEIGKILDKPDTFGNDSPVIFHAAYDPLFAQKGISDQILINYFAR